MGWFPLKSFYLQKSTIRSYLKKKIIFRELLCVHCHFACQLNGARTSTFGLRRAYFYKISLYDDMNVILQVGFLS
jgi:hypothetical protein